MLRYFFVFMFVITPPIWAEYRVFELEITTYASEDPASTPAPASVPDVKTPPPEEIGKRVVLSTLDPEQYRGYHIVQANEKIRYISTWRCPGRTAGKDYCPNPKAKTEGEVAAAPSENK